MKRVTMLAALVGLLLRDAELGGGPATPGARGEDPARHGELAASITLPSTPIGNFCSSPSSATTASVSST